MTTPPSSPGPPSAQQDTAVGSEVGFLLTHSAVYGLGTVVSQIVSFLLLPVYTRHLTPADYGALETIDVSSGIVGIVVTVGIARALSRFYYEADDEAGRRRVVSTAYLTYVGLSALALPVLFALSGPLARLLLAADRYASLFRIGFLSLLLAALTDIGMMYLRLTKRPKVFVSVTTVRLLLMMGLNVLFVAFLGQGIAGVLYSALIVNATAGLLMASLVLARTGVRFSAGLSGELVRYSLPMVPSNLGNTVVKQSDKFFVLYLMSVADMGIYSLSLKVGNAIHNLLTVPFNMAYIPRRFELMKHPDAKRLYARLFTYYVFCVGFVGLCLSVLIPEVLQLLVTPEFFRAKSIVPLVILSMVIFGSHYHFDFGILRSRQTKYLSYIGVTSAAVQVGLNWLLIRHWGFVGAVASSTLSLALQALLLYRVSRKLYPIPYEFGRLGRFAVVVLLWYAVSTFIHWEAWLANAGAKVLLLLCLPMALRSLGIVTQEEVQGVRRRLSAVVHGGSPERHAGAPRQAT